MKGTSAAALKKILLIEDNPGDAALIEEMLASYHGAYTLDCHDRLASGLARMEDESFDVVLLDLGLPDSGGLDTLRRIQTKQSALPVIVLTGLTDEALAAETISLGAQDYLIKGRIDSDLLSRAITYAIERKSLIEHLRKSEEHFREAFRNAAIGMAITDTRGCFLQVNAALCRILGRTEQELVRPGVNFTLFTHPDDLETHLHELDRLIRGEITSFFIEKRCIRTDGAKVWVRVSSSARTDRTGRPFQVVSLVEDIDDRKKLEDSIRRRNAELREVNKELEAFSYSVAHDLRAPLRSIAGFSRILDREYREILDENGRDFLARIVNSVDKMDLIINDLLRLSKIVRQEMVPASLDLSLTVREIAAELRSKEPERTADFQITPGIVVNADPSLMKIALENLLGNAWKFTSHRALTRIEFGTANWHGRQAFFVKDNGVGFDMDQASRLFVPFQRLHSETEFPGTGIGLATVFRIIRRSGGEIWAEGTPDKGAVFYFTLG